MALPGCNNRPLFADYYRPEQPRFGKWGRYQRAIVLASACLVFLLLYPLNSMFGLSNIRIFGGSGSYTEMFRADDPDKFLIGVGKADITG